MFDPRDQIIEQLRQIIAQLQQVVAEQQQLIGDLRQQLVEQDAAHAARATKLEAEVKRLERELLGPKTEKTRVPPVERDLEKGELTDEERQRRREEIADKRRARAAARAAAVENRDIDHPVPDDKKVCPTCNGTKFRSLDPETSVVWEYVPGHFVRHTHRREKLACSCGKHIVVAPPPPKLVVGGQFGFGFAAFLVVEKCGDSVPIYRIEKRFERMGIPMSRATMNDILHAAAECAKPLAARLAARVAALEIVLADETSMRLQDRKKRGFFWVFHGHDPDSNGELVLYQFATNRSGDTPDLLLGGTTGKLLVDGYTGYNHVTEPTGRERAGCWCHLRRKLFEARDGPGDDADVAIAKLRALFRVEHDAKELGVVGKPEHLEMREKRSRPIVDDFYQWVRGVTALPKSPLGEAITYATNQRKRLELFLTDARLPPHNNASERALRCIALGRKNYLFVGHPRAGRNIAVL